MNPYIIYLSSSIFKPGDQPNFSTTDDRLLKQFNFNKVINSLNLDKNTIIKLHKIQEVENPSDVTMIYEKEYTKAINSTALGTDDQIKNWLSLIGPNITRVYSILLSQYSLSTPHSPRDLLEKAQIYLLQLIDLAKNVKLPQYNNKLPDELLLYYGVNCTIFQCFARVVSFLQIVFDKYMKSDRVLWIFYRYLGPIMEYLSNMVEIKIDKIIPDLKSFYNNLKNSIEKKNANAEINKQLLSYNGQDISTIENPSNDVLLYLYHLAQPIFSILSEKPAKPLIKTKIIISGEDNKRYKFTKYKNGYLLTYKDYKSDSEYIKLLNEQKPLQKVVKYGNTIDLDIGDEFVEKKFLFGPFLENVESSHVINLSQATRVKYVESQKYLDEMRNDPTFKVYAYFDNSPRQIDIGEKYKNRFHLVATTSTRTFIDLEIYPILHNTTMIRKQLLQCPYLDYQSKVNVYFTKVYKTLEKLQTFKKLMRDYKKIPVVISANDENVKKILGSDIKYPDKSPKTYDHDFVKLNLPIYKKKVKQMNDENYEREKQKIDYLVKTNTIELYDLFEYYCAKSLNKAFDFKDKNDEIEKFIPTVKNTTNVIDFCDLFNLLLSIYHNKTGNTMDWATLNAALNDSNSKNLYKKILEKFVKLKIEGGKTHFTDINQFLIDICYLFRDDKLQAEIYREFNDNKVKFNDNVKVDVFLQKFIHYVNYLVIKFDFEHLQSDNVFLHEFLLCKMILFTVDNTLDIDYVGYNEETKRLNNIAMSILENIKGSRQFIHPCDKILIDKMPNYEKINIPERDYTILQVINCSKNVNNPPINYINMNPYLYHGNSVPESIMTKYKEECSINKITNDDEAYMSNYATLIGMLQTLDNITKGTNHRMICSNFVDDSSDYSKFIKLLGNFLTLNTN